MFAPLPKDVRHETAFGPIVQLAYHAPDIPAAAQWFADELGAGPFFLMEHIPLASAHYRGEPSQFDHSSAYGQLGDIMIELIKQHGDTPSAIRDMYDVDTPGLHHAAVFVDDVQQAIDTAQAQGQPCALDAKMADGFRFAMVDAREARAHMLEFYTPVASLKEFYGFVAQAAEGWDGKDVLRGLGSD
ncbi:MAG: VOC family protein [Pseudomonadota bacterium]